MPKRFMLVMLLITLVGSLALVTRVLSQSSTKERGAPEPFECSTMAHINYSKKHLKHFERRERNNMSSHGNKADKPKYKVVVPKGTSDLRILHCRVGKLDCAYSLNHGNISCVKSSLL